MHRFIHAAAILIAALTSVLSCVPCAASDKVIDIGSRRELFVDSVLIDRLEGAELRLQTPRSAGVALQLDKPWERHLSGYFTVFRDGDGDVYRMYYRGRPLTGYGDGNEKAQEVTCVAESNDGREWSRPRVGKYEIAGTRDNNIVLANLAPVTHNFAPFIDTRPGVPAAQRYKGVGGSRDSGLIPYTSADGIHWERLQEKPIITGGAFDSQNNIFWSDLEQCYVCFYRTFRNGVRWISRTTSKDFTTWSEVQHMTFGSAPNEHLYTNQTEPYFRASHIYVGTAARFWPDRQALSDAEVKTLNLEGPDNYAGLKQGCSDSVLITSRGGERYDRTFLESWVRPGGELQNWTARSNYPARGIVQTGPREMSLYVQRHYGQPTTYIERLTLRLDGFASLHGPYAGGELVTKPFTFTGSKLSLNFATSAAGSVRVELQTVDGAALPGFALTDCKELVGDDINRSVIWPKGDLRQIGKQPIRLKISLRDADVYSFQFQD
jgi:hypothetical protein